MSEGAPGDRDEDPTTSIYHHTVAPTTDDANYRVLEAIADVEDVDVTTLPPMYDRIDHMLDELFSRPPAPEAQVEVTFSYHGYRITVDQSGEITLRRLDDGSLEGLS